MLFTFSYKKLSKFPHKNCCTTTGYLLLFELLSFTYIKHTYLIFLNQTYFVRPGFEIGRFKKSDLVRTGPDQQNWQHLSRQVYLNTVPLLLLLAAEGQLGLILVVVVNEKVLVVMVGVGEGAGGGGGLQLALGQALGDQGLGALRHRRGQAVGRLVPRVLQHQTSPLLLSLLLGLWIRIHFLRIQIQLFFSPADPWENDCGSMRIRILSLDYYWSEIF